jgi:signal transduction histidine kinase
MPTAVRSAALPQRQFVFSLQGLDEITLPCRVVASDRRVLWQSPALTDLLQGNGAWCCESLGFHHHDDDCPSAITFRSGRSCQTTRWLGKVYMLIETALLRDANGAPVCFETFRDITGEKRLEGAYIEQQEILETVNRAMIEINHNLEAVQKELEEKNSSLESANEKLRALDHMKDEFISIVSHELKAPLTAIKGSVDLIQNLGNGQLAPTVHELLSVCQRNTNRLHLLVQDLLDVARIESGRLSLNFLAFDVVDFVRETTQSIQSLADQKQLGFITEIEPGLTMEADRNRLQQVLINLLSNAIKFTDYGAITIMARRDAHYIRFNIIDTGVGIPENEQTRIFEKFAQVDGVLHRNTGGTGLGLSIVRGIIREHGGDISVNSTLGVGSNFSFTIPQPPGKGNTHDKTGPLD